ncbi:MAG: hypothetical protein H6661_04080 [Ardenticatenaceae bacterium]|nr:hypothetical protein [Ardenticatenaceae bacterium]
MNASFKREFIATNLLLLDINNPRLSNVNENQYDTIRAMLKSQPTKILNLAEHFLNNGSNPASIPIVTPSNADPHMYEVLDGNRRLTAIKVLETPSLADGILRGKNLEALNRLSKQYAANPITEVYCVILPDRDNANEWIRLIHRGQQDGVGLVEWSGQVAARFDSRKEQKPDAALEVLDLVREHGNLSPKTIERIEAGEFPITNLGRLVNTRYVRQKLGIEKARGGHIQTLYPLDEIIDGLTRVVDEIGLGQITVSSIKNQPQRIDYVNRLSPDILPNESAKLKTPMLLSEALAVLNTNSDSTDENGNKETNKRGANNKKRASSTNRSKLIPSSCKLNIDQVRIKKIYGELKKIDVDDLPNATAVMLRVFIELSLDHFLETVAGWSEQQRSNTYLRNKLEKVASYFEANDTMTKDQLAPVLKAASGQTMLVASVKSMNQYVHNRYFNPIPTELKATWDDLQKFMECLWP